MIYIVKWLYIGPNNKAINIYINPFSTSPFFGQVQKFFLENL